MQQPNYTPMNAQHVPAGWSYPTPAAAAMPQLHAAPVIGGGATATVTRVRWGRLLLVIAGVFLLGFGMWSVAHDGSPTTNATVRGGGGGDELAIARDARSDVGADASTETDSDASATPTTSTAPRVSAPARVGGSTNLQHRRPAVRRTTRRGARRAAASGAASVRHVSRAVAAAAPRPRRTASGGGVGASGELPLTGIETWIAGILGALLLIVGIGVHVNAVRIAATAMLYRRGILLRPVDCARLAQERGVPRLRVLLSNILHELLEKPAPSDFVGTRLAR